MPPADVTHSMLSSTAILVTLRNLCHKNVLTWSLSNMLSRNSTCKGGRLLLVEVCKISLCTAPLVCRAGWQNAMNSPRKATGDDKVFVKRELVFQRDIKGVTILLVALKFKVLVGLVKAGDEMFSQLCKCEREAVRRGNADYAQLLEVLAA